MPAKVKAPTDFERRLSAKVDELMALGKTGYVWQPIDEMLMEELPVPGQTRCKKAGGSGRAANVLTESNDKDIALYLVFVVDPYTVKAFHDAASSRIPRFPNLRSVAIADRATGMWRVREFVERAGIVLGERLREHFPLVEKEDLYSVGSATEQESPPASVVPAEDEDVFETAAESYLVRSDGFEALVEKFTRYAEESGVTLDITNALDVLASVLSGQFLLFAGPSGTGKSTVARLLASFFAPPDAWRIVDARRQWIGPEDVFGYYSPLTGYFALTSETAKLVDLHEASVQIVRKKQGAKPTAPILLVEEMNLSAIEGYLAPVVHGLSTPSASHVKWPLHAKAEGASDAEGSVLIPRNVLLGPFPRVLGTINVDQMSQAPARKVTARANVVLLEPDARFDTDSTAAFLKTKAGGAEPPSANAPGREWIGDPATLRLKLDDPSLIELAQALEELLGKVHVKNEKALQLSRRDLVRLGNYMSYYIRLGAAAAEGTTATEIRRLAAENAFLHLVLPGLPADQFRSCVAALSGDGAVAAESQDPKKLGGLLSTRLERLSSAGSRFAFAEALDFWTSLS